MPTEHENLDTLFNDVTAAITSGDSSKLNEVMTVQEEVPVSTTTDGNTSDTSTDEEVDDVSSKEIDDTPQDAESVSETSQEDDSTSAEDRKLEELREQLESLRKENHSLKSQAGRVPHVQRKIQELDKKLAELSATPSRPSTAINEQLANKISSIKDADPELAEVLQEITNTIIKSQEEAAAAAASREKDTLTLLREQEYAAHQEIEAQKLLSMFDNAREVFASNSWKEWKESQSAAVKALADGDTAADVARAFKLYEIDMRELYPSTVPTAPNPKAKQLEEERQRRQARTASVASPTAPARNTLPSDPDKLFEYYQEKIRKEMQG